MRLLNHSISKTTSLIECFSSAVEEYVSGPKIGQPAKVRQGLGREGWSVLFSSMEKLL